MPRSHPLALLTLLLASCAREQAGRHAPPEASQAPPPASAAAPPEPPPSASAAAPVPARPITFTALRPSWGAGGVVVVLTDETPARAALVRQASGEWVALDVEVNDGAFELRHEKGLSLRGPLPGGNGKITFSPEGRAPSVYDVAWAVEADTSKLTFPFESGLPANDPHEAPAPLVGARGRITSVDATGPEGCEVHGFRPASPDEAVDRSLADRFAEVLGDLCEAGVRVDTSHDGGAIPGGMIEREPAAFAVTLLLRTTSRRGSVLHARGLLVDAKAKQAHTVASQRVPEAGERARALALSNGRASFSPLRAADHAAAAEGELLVLPTRGELVVPPLPFGLLIARRRVPLGMRSEQAGLYRPSPFIARVVSAVHVDF